MPSGVPAVYQWCTSGVPHQRGSLLTTGGSDWVADSGRLKCFLHLLKWFWFSSDLSMNFHSISLRSRLMENQLWHRMHELLMVICIWDKVLTGDGFRWTPMSAMSEWVRRTGNEWSDAEWAPIAIRFGHMSTFGTDTTPRMPIVCDRLSYKLLFNKFIVLQNKCRNYSDCKWTTFRVIWFNLDSVLPLITPLITGH